MMMFTSERFDRHYYTQEMDLPDRTEGQVRNAFEHPKQLSRLGLHRGELGDDLLPRTALKEV